MFGVCNFLMSLYAAIKANNQLKIIFICPIDTLKRHTITLLISVGYVEIYFCIKLFEIGINQCHGRSSVHIIISVNQNLFFCLYCQHYSFHSLFHVVHKERIVQMLILGTKEFFCFLIAAYTPLHKKRCNYFIGAKLISCGVFNRAKPPCQSSNQLTITLLFYRPALFHSTYLVGKITTFF